jgi:hypothetical protein
MLFGNVVVQDDNAIVSTQKIITTTVQSIKIYVDG